MVPIGDMHKMNKNSIEPCEFEHEQPIKFSKKLVEKSENVR